MYRSEPPTRVSHGRENDLVTIDLLYLGEARAVACCLLEGDEPVLIDPGPASTIPALHTALGARGLRPSDIAHVLLTHIHLDHAGAAGTLVRDNPRITTYVHETGAPHIIDPERLLSSAQRIYGDALPRLFGEVAPVPCDRVRVLHGGETLRLGERVLDVAHTPGHARHHISYLDRATGTAFIGDTGGIRNGMAGPVVPVTPPPDIDLRLWSHSLDVIAAWRPDRLFVTHFGELHDPEAHVAALRDALADWAQRMRALLAQAGSDEEHARRFALDVAQQLRSRYGERAEWYVAGADLESSARGLIRWLRRGS